MGRHVALVSGLIIALVAGAIGFLIFTSDGKQAMQSTAKRSGDASVPDQQNSNRQPGKYIDYSEVALANTAGTKLIFFHASWCPQCRALEANIKDRGLPEGVTILKTDYDKSQELRQKYGVTIQTTVVRVDDQGNLVKKYVAYDEPTLEAVIKNLL